MPAHRERGLVEAQGDRGVDAQRAERVRLVAALGVLPAQGQVLKDGLLEPRAHVLHKLDPQVEQQLPGLFLGQGFGGEVLLVVGPHVLVKAPGRDRPAILLDVHGQVGEPKGLQGLGEIAGRLGGHAAAGAARSAPARPCAAGRALGRACSSARSA